MQLGFPYGNPGQQTGQVLQFKGLQSVYSLLIWLSILVATGAAKPAEADPTRQAGVRKGVAKGKIPAPTPPVGRLTNNTLLPARQATALDFWHRQEYIVHRVRSGDTLPRILDRFNLTASDKELWNRSIRQHFRSGKLAPGRQVHFYFAKPDTDANRATESLMAVEVDFDDWMDLTWEKTGRSVFFARREKPVNVELRTATATIDDSIFTSGMKAGIHSSLLSQLTDIFTWDVDLENIYQGDSFKILYEQRSTRGQPDKPQLRILAAELINAGQKKTAIYFEKQKGMGGYYNDEGRSLARSFLRSPLEFANITSTFSESRFHPVLKTSLPHTGVDFAAERGTPVRAVGDGIINQAAWSGSYGKLVEIQHDAGFATRYAHLSGYGNGIRKGSVVKKGQVIGFVGSTGRTTGPHLHFELYKDQQYINPLSLDFLPPEDSIEPALLTVFEDQKNTFLVELTSLPQS